MQIQTNAAGYNLYEESNGKWTLENLNPIFSGTLKEVGLFMVREIGFSMPQLEMALNAMADENHNAAHFGVFKKFIYSYERDKYVGKAS